MEDLQSPFNNSLSSENAAKRPLPRVNPRDLLSPKIREFLIQAEKHGFDWAWADTLCCIDKASSAELTEAINSMFRYYSLSTVCYAYLSDASQENVRSRIVGPGFFRSSRWHTRGWTLQELLALTTVLFMSHQWTELGNKYTLAEELEIITGIPARVLRFE